MTKLTHEQAYILGSIAKHADNYRRNLKNLHEHTTHLMESKTPRSIATDYASKAQFAYDSIETLLDQCDEMFCHLDPAEQSRIYELALTPTEKGLRHRFSVDVEV